MPKAITTHQIPLLTPEEMRGVRTCLDLLQQAQGLCELAAQQLCPVRGFVHEWDKLTAPIDQIKYAWHDVETRRAWLIDMAARGTAPREVAVDVPTSTAAKSRGRRSRKGGVKAFDEFAQAAAEARDQAECPECGAVLRDDGSCCDKCPWTRPE